MFSIKRIASTGLLIVMMSALMPAQIVAAITSQALIQITSATQSFNPANGSAVINYQVMGGSYGTAKNVTVTIYTGFTNGGLTLCDSSSGKVTIQNATDRAPGTYPATWSPGANTTPGPYCYRLIWTNPPQFSTPILEGIITVTQQSGGGQMGGGSGNNGSGTDLSKSITVNYVDPSKINPTANQKAYINYTVNQDLPNGFSLDIYNGNNLIKNLYSTSSLVKKGASSTLAWDGRSGSNNAVVAAGDYLYKFTVSGKEIASGLITVTYSGSGYGLADVVFYADKAKFDPKANEKVTIYYTVNNKLTSGLQIYIQNPSNNNLPIATLAATNLTVQPKNDSVTWNGKDSAGNPFAEGTYKYVFMSGGSQIGSGNIQIAYAAVGGSGGGATGQFITFHSVNPQTFYPTLGQKTTIFYTLGKDVTNFKVSVKSFSGTYFQTLLVSSSKKAGYYPTEWDGYIANQWGLMLLAPDGDYTYTLEAANETAVTGTITVGTIQQQNPLVITDLGPNQNSFNPSAGGTTTFSYKVNQDARVDFKILSGIMTVKKLLVSGFNNNAFANNTNTLTWDGRYDAEFGGQIVPAGTYTYMIEARTNTGLIAQSVTGFITVVTGSNYSQLDVTNLSVNPNPFNADTQNASISFNLNYNANATISVTRKSNNEFIKYIAINKAYNAGANTNAETWTGTDQYGSLVSADIYVLKIEASNSFYGSDSMTTDVQVTRNGSTPPPSNILDVSSVSANPSTFNPSVQNTLLTFYLNYPAYVTITVTRYVDNMFIKTVIQNQYYNAGTNSVSWNGTDQNGYIALNASYNFLVSATSSTYGNDSAMGTVVINSTGTGGVGGGGNCANFSDVSTSNDLCKAVEFVKSKGIFAGYPDGTIGIDKVIQRAELLPVIQKAFKYSLESYNSYNDGDLDYPDLKKKTNEWYMPYVKTFSNLGLMVGYPDGKMRPERTMTTAELYLVFLRAAKKSPTGAAHFTVTNTIKYAPFNDTPVTNDRKWYLKYAFFAKLNTLVKGKFFHPDEGITRGQVIKLIYDTYKKGLITY